MSPVTAWSPRSWDHDPDDLAAALGDRLDEPARRWLAEATRRLGEDPTAVLLLSPGTARHVGRAPLAEDPDDSLLGTVDDLARVVLLTVALPRLPGPEAAALLGTLYGEGDAAERRAVLRTLPHLDPVPVVAARLVDDALRTNDLRLVAAAVGRCATVLDAAAWRQSVLKCLFVGVPLRCVHGLEQRRDAELAAMTARYVAERVAAGRDVPDDVALLLSPGSPALAQAGLEEDLHRGHPDRLAAAGRARQLLEHRPAVPAGPQET